MSSDEELWAVVEVMGHAKYAGRVSEYTALGVPLMRVEVPAVGEQPAFEKLLGSAAIFRITPCTREVAEKAAAQFRVEPLALVHLPAPAPTRPMYLERHECDDEDEDGWNG